VSQSTWLENLFKILFFQQVVHAWNSSYLGGRDQEDRSLKLPWGNSSRDPILKIPITKKGWQSGLSSSPSTAKKKKKKKNPRETDLALLVC
jgi:hypothetical protein